MRVLLDIPVLAELRHPQPNPIVKAAVVQLANDDVYVSALIFGEITRGINLLADGRKKRALNSWLSILIRQFADRVLPIDHEVACLWGDISARAQTAGIVLPEVDGILVATALHHGLYLMTRHSNSLAATGVLIIDPWKDS